MLRRLCSALLLLVATLSATPVVSGLLARRGLDELTRTLNARDWGGTLETLSYTQGYLTSTAVSHLTLDTFGLVMEHEITHGPFPDRASFEAVRVVTRVWPRDGALRAMLDQPLAEFRLESPLRTQRFSVSGTLAPIDGAGLSADGGTLHAEGDLAGREVSLSGELRGFLVANGPRDRAELGLARASATITRKETGIAVPAASLELDSARFENPENAGTWKSAAVHWTTREHGNLVDLEGAVSVQELEFRGERVDELVIDVALLNLTRAFIQQIQERGTDGLPERHELETLAQTLAPHGPALELRRLRAVGHLTEPGSFSTDFSGRVAIDPERFHQAGGGEHALILALDLDFAMEMNEHALARDFVQGMRLAAAQNGVELPEDSTVIQRMQELGFLVRSGENLALEIAMRGPADIRINSKPFDPMKLAALLAPTPGPSRSLTSPTPHSRPTRSYTRNPAAPADEQLEEMRRQIGLD